MKFSEKKLNQIIKESIQNVLNEEDYNNFGFSNDNVSRTDYDYGKDSGRGMTPRTEAIAKQFNYANPKNAEAKEREIYARVEESMEHLQSALKEVMEWMSEGYGPNINASNKIFDKCYKLYEFIYSLYGPSLDDFFKS
jgi:hypothetical protein